MATNLARLFIAALGALVLVTMAGRAQFATLPEGPSRDLVEQVCGGCHDIGMVAINGRSGERWRLTIDEMTGAMGCGSRRWNARPSCSI